jgi:magnesium chelatase subunit D
VQVVLAREYLKDVEVAPEQVAYLVEEARRGGVMGHRAELFAVKVGGVRGWSVGLADEVKLTVKLQQGE